MYTHLHVVGEGKAGDVNFEAYQVDFKTALLMKPSRIGASTKLQGSKI